MESSRKTTVATPSAALSVIPALTISREKEKIADFELDPFEKELGTWLKESNNGNRDQIIQDMMSFLTSSNAMEIVRSLPPELLETPVGIKGLELWSASDHAAAASWLSAQSNIDEAEVSAVVHGWQSSDQAEFQNFCNGLSDGDFKQMALQTVSYEEVNRDPESAINWAMQMNPGDMQTSLLQASVEQWVLKNPDAAINWLNQVADPNLKEHLFASAAQGYAAIDPIQAVDWVNQFVTSQDVLDQSVAGIAQSWAAQDPSATGDWLASFPDGTDRDIGMQNLLIIWKSSNPSMAQNWIAQLPDGDFKTEAESTFAKVNTGYH